MKQKSYFLKIWRPVVAGLLALFLSFISLEFKTHNHFDVSAKSKSEFSQKKDLSGDNSICFVCLFNLILNLSAILLILDNLNY